MSWLSRYEDCHTHLPVEEEDSLDDNINFDVNNKKGYLVLYAIVLPNNIEGNPATDRTIELKMCNGTTRRITIPASISFEPGISYELTLKDFPEEEESNGLNDASFLVYSYLVYMSTVKQVANLFNLSN